jgi:gas vesicle protein
MSNSTSSSGTVLIAFALGALAGAAVGLLYAPASGEHTRRRLVAKGREARDKAQGLADGGREFIQRQRDNLVDVADRTSEAFEQARKGAL